MRLGIEPSTAGHHAAIKRVVAAFPDEDLLPLAADLLARPDCVHSFVALADGEVAGFAAFTECRVEGTEQRVALLGPLAVDPSRQRRGVGTALVRHGVAAMRERGMGRPLLLGDPNYYGRLGFTSERHIAPLFALPPAWRDAWQSMGNDVALEGRLIVPDPWNDPALWLP